MKRKYFTIPLLAIAIWLAFFSPAAQATSEHIYNFVGITSPSPTTSAYAEDGEYGTVFKYFSGDTALAGNAFNPDGIANVSELSQAEYDATEAEDTSRAQSIDPMWYRSALFRYRFVISEEVAAITQIDVKWVGYANTYSDTNRFELCIFNNNTNTWQFLDDAPGTSDQTLEGSVINDILYYIDGSKYLYLGVGNRTVAEPLFCNYVEVKVTYRIPPATPSLTAPTDGSVSVSRTVTLDASAFSGDGNHLSSSWEVYDSSSFDSGSLVAYSYGDSDNKTAITVNSSNLTFQNSLAGLTELKPLTRYWLRVKYENEGGQSSWSASDYDLSTEANVVPDTPSITDPGDGVTGVGYNPTISSSIFSDADPDDTHYYSDWEISTTEAFNSGDIVWYSYNDTNNKTEIVVNSTNGIFQNALAGHTSLEAATQYYVRVGYTDNYGGNSTWSVSDHDFTTAAAPPPATPTIESPADGTTNVSRTVSLSSSAYSGTDTHLSSDWEISDYGTGGTGDFTGANLVAYAYADTANKTSITVNSTNFAFQNSLSGLTELEPSSRYWIRVRYTDGNGTSAWSASTYDLSTEANVLPGTPSIVFPVSGTTNESKSPTLTTSSFSDLDPDDTQFGSDWEVSDDGSFSGTDIVAYSYDDSSHKTSITVNSSNMTFQNALAGKSVLDPLTQYWFRVRHIDKYNGKSSWSSSTYNLTTKFGGEHIYNYAVMTSESGTHRTISGHITVPDPTDPPSNYEDGTYANTIGSRDLSGEDLQDDVELSPAEYDEIESSNDVRYTVPQPPFVFPMRNAILLHEFYIDENPAAVERIDVIWEGYQSQAVDKLWILIWNYEYNKYHVLENSQQTADYNFSGAITSDCDHFIGPSNEVTILAFDEDQWQPFYCDYVELKVSFKTPPAAPSIVSPTDGSVNVSRTITLEASPFSGEGNHLSSSWEVYDNSAFNSTSLVAYSYGDTVNKTAITVTPANFNFQNSLVGLSELKPSTRYWFRARYANEAGNSDWSSADYDLSTEANVVPNMPSITDPASGETGVGYNPTISSSIFSDPDPDDTHYSSDWEISTTEGFSGSDIVWFSYGDVTNEVEIVVNDTNGIFQNALAGETSLKAGAIYYVRVRYLDNYGGISNWSASGHDFTTATAPPPATPTIESPADGSTNVSREVVLGSSAYSGTGSHASSDWEISDYGTGGVGDFSGTHLVAFSYSDATNKTTIVVNAANLTFQNSLAGLTELEPSKRYWFRVRYNDENGTSNWSSSNYDLSTEANVVPNTPTINNPPSGTTGVSRSPTLTTSTFSDLDPDDTHYSSDWEISDDGSFSGTDIVAYSSDDTSHKTSMTVSSANMTFQNALAGKASLASLTQYWFRVRYADKYGGKSAWSTSTYNLTTKLAAESTYNFVGVTYPSSSHRAEDGEYDPFSGGALAGQPFDPQGMANMDELSQAQYDAIEANDGSRATTPAPGFGDNAFYCFKFVISEEVSAISQIDATWIGYAAADDAVNQIELCIFNSNTNTWEFLDEDHSTTDITLSGIKISNISYYIDSDDCLYLGVGNRDDNQTLTCNYVEAKITYNTAPAAPVINTPTDGSTGINRNVLLGASTYSGDGTHLASSWEVYDSSTFNSNTLVAYSYGDTVNKTGIIVGPDKMVFQNSLADLPRLKRSTQYWFRVCYTNQYGRGNWSAADYDLTTEIIPRKKYIIYKGIKQKNIIRGIKQKDYD